ncbi:MAG TPA: HDOD domain-containing protein, partial [Opitutus sp.]|nr:HDOD domain-containing protein [Opitutus sp.]
MAHLLLVDPADVARKAMKGIVARGGHRLVAVESVAEAWEFIQRNAAVDLIFLELKLTGEGGLALVQRLRADPLLNLMPVVIYTAAGDRDSVRQAMELKVQNFLVKPYLDESILGEIRKALLNPWRQRHFEEEKSFCAMMGYTPEGLHQTLGQLQTALETATPALLEQAQIRRTAGVLSIVTELSGAAEAAGAWGVVEVLNTLRLKAEQGLWTAFADGIKLLGFAQKLIFTHLKRSLVPPDFVTDDERNEAELAARRTIWFSAAAENRLPVVTWPQLAAQLENLSGCPVIDSVAASFQMSATGHPSSLAPLMDLAEKDPGLAVHLLSAANRMRRNDDLDPEPLENPRIAVSLLGEIKLAGMTSTLLTAEERWMHLPPCSWISFWMFQIGVARMARYTCRYLEFNSLESRAYVAGLIHDIGKLLLLHLHPIGFEAVLDHSRRENVPLAVAEKQFLGCTTREMAAHFAERHGILPSYAHVMRWVDEPMQTPEDAVLVASVSLARELCRQNRVGWSG